MEMEQLKTELKQLIVDECEKETAAAEISDSESLINGQLKLDSLDILQCCMAIKNRYGARIEGSSSARKAFVSIETLAATIDQQRNR